jgi:glycosyltransferase involved in cell wall biosynthesis
MSRTVPSGGPSPPLVSVIVPVLNGEETIRDCLVSVLETDYPPERREILVVDNGSTDRTPEIIKVLPVSYLREERRGAAAARNKGIGASTGEILAFTDADCVVTRGWLRELVGGLADGTSAGIEGEILVYPVATPAARYAAKVGTHTHRRNLQSPLSPFVDTANVAFNREVFRRVGSFDTRFPAAGFEDIDFSWRVLRENDLDVSHNPKAVVFHRPRATTRRLLSQHIRYGRNVAILRDKYPLRLPWDWRQELRAWGAVGRLGWLAGRAAIRHWYRGGDRMDVYEPSLTFIRKLGVRLGFLWEKIGRGNR